MGVSAALWVVLGGILELSGWLAGIICAGVFLTIYGLALFRLRSAMIGLGRTASDLLGDGPESPPVPVGIEELDSLAVSLHDARQRFRSSEEALRSERSLLEVVLEALPGGVLLVEADNRVAYSNSACRQMLGMVADPSGRLALRSIEALVRKVRQSDEPFEETMTRGYPQRTLGVRAIAMDTKGRALVIILDLTETRRVETMRRDFVTDASHELKTPLASILASAEALEIALDRDPESSRMFAEQISSAGLRMSRLITDLLDLSRLESQDPSAEEIDLEEVVQTEVESFMGAAQGKSIDLLLHTVPVEVKGSSAELGLAIRNLCDNALRYTEEGGRIEVSLDVSGGDAILMVTDTGMGIPGRDLGRIFERFYRVDVARSRRTGGTGLGLAIVKHVVERHGGKVTVKSLLGEGSSFILRVPSMEKPTLPS